MTPKVVVRALMVLGVGSFVGDILLTQYLLMHRPGYPHPEIGRIYELNEHGRIVYVTYHEQLVQLLLPYVGLFFVIAGFTVQNEWKGPRP